MPKNLKRYYGRGDLHSLTFSCYRRLPLLKTMRARNLFVQALSRIRERAAPREEVQKQIPPAAAGSE